MLNRNFREFVALLDTHGVKYLIVGGYAVGFHGHPRYTSDLDILVAAGPENAAKLVRVFAEIDGLRLPFIGLEELLKRKTALRDETDAKYLRKIRARIKPCE